EALDKLWKITVRVFRPEAGGVVGTRIGWFRSKFEPLAGLATLAMIPAALIGLVVYGFERARVRLAREEGISSPGLFRDALLIPPLIYLAFCVINFQAGPDLIPFFPFIGVFAGWFFVRAGEYASSVNWIKRKDRRLINDWHFPALALLAILIVIVTRAATYRVDSWTLQYQEQQFK